MNGHARLSGEETPCLDDLRAAEGIARTAKRGLWADRAYGVRKAVPPGELFRLENTFQIVEGEVHAVAKTKRTLYLNFGEDWRRDFTFAIRNRAIRNQAIDAEELAGKKVRGRGWVVIRNGPLIEITDPAQLEVLDKP